MEPMVSHRYIQHIYCILGRVSESVLVAKPKCSCFVSHVRFDVKMLIRMY